MNPKPILLIPDCGPLGALAINGADKLDCLFAFGAPVHITDMVIEESTRNTNLWWNRDVAAWLEYNRDRYVRVETATGMEYLDAVASWRQFGSPPGLEPQTKNKGDRSIQDAIEQYENNMQPDETIIAIVDDRQLRKRLSRADVNIELITTFALFSIIETELHAGVAEEMWRMVKLANPTADGHDEHISVRNVS